MKNLPAMSIPVSMKLPHIYTKITTDFIKAEQAAGPLNAPARPSEEMLRHLNRIGHEYPFCVYYKQKMHDPL